jgi:hypothetical protein
VSSPIWGSWPDISYPLTVTISFDERTGLSFVYAVAPRQRSLYWVRLPWNSWPYFTLSDSRLPFSSPPMTRRVTVEVFDINCFHCIWHGPHRKQRVQQLFCRLACIRCRAKVCTESLPPNGRGIHIQTHGMMQGFIKYAVETESGVMMYIPSFINTGPGT